jgi:porphobilinogen synthase
MNRFRRLRASSSLRRMVRETHLNKSDLIYPIFVAEGRNIKTPVESMPGVYQYSADMLYPLLEKISKSGISGILIFGIPEHKDELGTSAYDSNGVTQQAIRYIKEKYPELIVIADVCLCEYTSHGHCGVVCDGRILNDETLPLLSKMAVSLAQAGADIIAPSDMMDGRVRAIREALDKSSFSDVPIMSYSAKFASGYYSPFRDAAQSAPSFGDRRTYQMDCANGREAMREIADDIEEGADMIIVKPALAYLDILKSASDRFELPVAAYNVSGEYSMVKAAVSMGWIDEKRIVMENLTAIKRAGANMIITYHALDAAGWLEENYEY